MEISLDGSSYVAQVTQDGRWSLIPLADLAFGSHQLTALATDPEQNVSDAAASRFAIVETGFARGGCATGGVPAPLLAVLALLFAATRRSRRGDTIRLVAGVLALVAAPSASRAQNIDVSLFRPAAGGDGFAAVEGARPPVDGESRLEVRTWTDYAFVPAGGLRGGIGSGRVAPGRNIVPRGQSGDRRRRRERLDRRSGSAPLPVPARTGMVARGVQPELCERATRKGRSAGRGSADAGARAGSADHRAVTGAARAACGARSRRRRNSG